MIEKAGLKDSAEAIYKQIADGGGMSELGNNIPYKSDGQGTGPLKREKKNQVDSEFVWN